MRNCVNSSYYHILVSDAYPRHRGRVHHPGEGRLPLRLWPWAQRSRPGPCGAGDKLYMRLEGAPGSHRGLRSPQLELAGPGRRRNVALPGRRGYGARRRRLLLGGGDHCGGVVAGNGECYGHRANEAVSKQLIGPSLALCGCANPKRALVNARDRSDASWYTPCALRSCVLACKEILGL